MNTSSFPTPQRALVLGGGGSTGNAWLIGVVAGLQAAGLDVSRADLTVGTSAGSTAAAQLTTTSAQELYAAILDAPDTGARPAANRPVSEHMTRIQGIIDSCDSLEQLHRAMSSAALGLPGADEPEFSERWRGIVAARFPGAQWPKGRTLKLTAVDASAGKPVVFENHSGVDLADAVAASCSSSLPYWLDGRAYIDGGYRRNENADLAQGCAKVLVLSPLGGRTLHPLAWGSGLDAQVNELREGGSQVRALLPDEPAQPFMGANAMNPALRPAAAREGHRQGRDAAAQLAQFWG
ncbi:patatin-like phospholipase family protein [Glutamicibacter sp.]|uniref:patatin-like phospholipase family protein n=1 Tax=Glutamicibacter sp. TaxID=1931995 RepID=UPI0028BF401E|nr:patatin-like phospholipase family protein [Glutamicibacter sp.]